jgi:peptidoglycan/xylan/chitin deacetylase (PgdA/CDA1 family)
MSDLLVLCYHAVSDRWPADLSISPAGLERQLAFLAEAGYVGATFHDAVRGSSATKTVAITFDDAYHSVLRLAFPLLERHGFPATVFVPTAFAERPEPMAWPGIDHWRGGPYEDELVPMTWGELRTLAAAGWEIGSHTRTHPRLTELDDATLSEELERSRADCEQGGGEPCRSLAYPYGAVDDRVAEAARSAGYAAGATLPRHLHAPSPLRWPRVGVYRRDGLVRYRLKVSPRIRWLRATKAWRLLGLGQRLGYRDDRAGLGG